MNYNQNTSPFERSIMRQMFVRFLQPFRAGFSNLVLEYTLVYVRRKRDWADRFFSVEQSKEWT